MKRSEAENMATETITNNPQDNAVLIRVMVADQISSWDDDQLADFLWGDSNRQEIKED